jgi:hypothetical protein
MKSKRARFAALAFSASLALPAAASTFDLYAIGSTHPGGALDPFGNPLTGMAIVSWTETLADVPSVPTLLSILAEGVDGGPTAPGGGEHDGVFVNGTLVGYLAQQSFYTPGFNLQPGPGAIAGYTAQSLSLFDVTKLLVAGSNTFEIRVDPSNWVNEIETVSLQSVGLAVREPASLALAALALSALVTIRRHGSRNS